MCSQVPCLALLLFLLVYLQLYYTIKSDETQVYSIKFSIFFLYTLYLSMRQMGLPFFAHKIVTPANFDRINHYMYCSACYRLSHRCLRQRVPTLY
nr:MAG TPA: hypothetical protein [Caudoviricetes sp.]